ncbi:MAG: DUF4234 domain-containing protein [Oscillospiraceae bacterium]|jgi:hypothetical protein|nr:DUF4234 domain-containing protein [Oscillospiraceae bacterium]
MYSKIRNPIAVILFSFFTGFIYYWYWLWVTNKQINELAGYEVMGDGMLILGWFCFPVAWYIWYKWDKALLDVAEAKGLRYGSNFILWVILSLVGIGPYVLEFQVQDTLNSAYGG